MKIRNGFVSNSSTSSFCLLGIWMEDEWYEEKIGKTEDLMDAIESLTSERSSIPMEIRGAPWAYIAPAVGISPWNLDEGLTLEENKEAIAKELQKVFGLEEPPRVSWHTYAWEDC